MGNNPPETKNQLRERTAIHKVSLYFIQQFGWLIREQNEFDYGVDMQVEIVDEFNYPTGILIALQVKGNKLKGGTFKPSTDKKFYKYEISKERHLTYWREYSIPVLFVWSNGQKIYWERISKNSIEIEDNEEKIFLKIPIENNLETTSKEQIIKKCFDLQNFDIIREENISNNMTKRYRVRVVVYDDRKFIVKKIIKILHEKYKNNYRADYLIIFYYRKISQVINNGFEFCKSEYNNSNINLNTINTNDSIGDINIEWINDSYFYNDYYLDNRRLVLKDDATKIYNEIIKTIKHFIRQIEETKKLEKKNNIISSIDIDEIFNYYDFNTSLELESIKKILISIKGYLYELCINFKNNNNIQMIIDEIKKDIKKYEYLLSNIYGKKIKF